MTAKLVDANNHENISDTRPARFGRRAHHPRRGTRGFSTSKRPPTFWICCRGPTASASNSKATKFISAPSSTPRPARVRRIAVSARSRRFTRPARRNMVSWIPNRWPKPPTKRIKIHVTAVGLVAAWKGLNEGPMLDEVCDRVRELKAGGKTRPDVSLGIIKKPARRRPLEGSRPGMLRPQPGKLAPLFSADLHHAHFRRPAGNHRLSEKGRHQDLFRRHHRHGRDARRPLRPRV